jgi:hypothetical protein
VSGKNNGGNAGQAGQAGDEQNGSGDSRPRTKIGGSVSQAPAPSANRTRLASPAVRRTPPRPAALAEVAIVGLFVVAEVFLARRLLHADTFFDEGTYLVSVDALRHGQTLGEQIFTAQPPGWYYLLDLVASVAGNSLEAIRSRPRARRRPWRRGGVRRRRALAGRSRWSGDRGPAADRLPAAAVRDPRPLGSSSLVLALAAWPSRPRHDAVRKDCSSQPRAAPRSGSARS